MKRYWYALFALFLSCTQRPVSNLKIIFALDKSQAELSTTQLKAARQAIEKFNAATNINGLAIELEVLDLTEQKIFSASNLQNYLQKNISKNTLLLGIILKNNIAKLKDALQDSSILYIGNTPFENRAQKPYLNIQATAFETNLYLTKFIRERRPRNSIYIIYTKNHKKQAQNFAVTMQNQQTQGQKLHLLEYTSGGKAQEEGQIRSIADFFRTQQQQLQEDSGIVFFFDQDQANIINSYLDRSPYQSLFEDLDFYLVGDELNPANLEDPDIDNYYVFQTSANRDKNFAAFREQYQKKYRLKAAYSNAEIFDAVCLLAYSAKNVLESQNSAQHKEQMASTLFRSMTQMTYTGITGPIFFNSEGNRISDHVVLQLADGAPKRLAYYAAKKEQFFFE